MTAPRFDYSHHLVELIARVEAASARLAAADPDRRAASAARARRESAFLSARLDGSPLAEDTVRAVDGGHVPAPPRSDLTQPAQGWAGALKLDGMDTQEVAALEYANLLALDAAEADLASACLRDPLEVVAGLHGLICQGLVDPDVIGAWRQTDQAIHDGAQGMVVYHAPAPTTVPDAMHELVGWIRNRTLVLPPSVTVGVVHQRVLAIQPFEAGNGRVARALARVLSRALGIDVHGAAVLERQLWADPLGYYAEVAATARRQGDLSIWLERHTGALARSLEAAADELSPRPVPTLPDRGRAVVAGVAPGGRLTIREYAQDAGVDLRQSRQDLLAFTRAGALVESPGGGGLVFTRPPSPER